MTDAEVFVFMDCFRGLKRVFPLRGDEDEIRDVGASYFKALRKYPLALVQAGAENCLQRNKHFPKPSEWIDAIPRREPKPDVEVLSVAAAHEYRRAESLRYEDAVCYCLACKEADIEKPIRFVPEFNADDTERKVREGERVVTMGHWAHGWELKRWYQARADFYNAFYTVFPTKVMK